MLSTNTSQSRMSTNRSGTSLKKVQELLKGSQKSMFVLGMYGLYTTKTAKGKRNTKSEKRR